MSSKVYGQFCPVARSLDVVGDRWTLLIVRDLLLGTRRFKDLQQSLVGIAPNLLSDRLRRLEDAGLVIRTFFKQLPPRVEYRLTDKGKGLESVVRSLARFGMLNLMSSPSRRDVIAPETIFQAMPTVFLNSRAKGVDAVYEIKLKGARGGTWFVHIEEGECTVGSEVSTEPDVVIETDVRTWVKLAVGAMDPSDAESAGKLTTRGNAKLAARFVTFFDRGHHAL